MTTIVCNRERRERKAIYSHIRWSEDCLCKEDAESFCLLWKKTIEVLAKELTVYVRLAPTIEILKDFESNTVHFFVRARISIGDPIITGQMGLVSLKPIYDNGEGLISFGIAPNDNNCS